MQNNHSGLLPSNGMRTGERTNYSWKRSVFTGGNFVMFVFVILSLNHFSIQITNFRTDIVENLWDPSSAQTPMLNGTKLHCFKLCHVRGSEILSQEEATGKLPGCVEKSPGSDQAGSLFLPGRSENFPAALSCNNKNRIFPKFGIVLRWRLFCLWGGAQVIRNPEMFFLKF